MCVCVYTCVCVYSVYVYACVCAYMCVCVYTCIHGYVYIHGDVHYSQFMFVQLILVLHVHIGVECHKPIVHKVYTLHHHYAVVMN